LLRSLHGEKGVPACGQPAGPHLIPFLLSRQVPRMRFLGFFRFSSRHNGRHILMPATLVAFAVFFGGAVRAPLGSRCSVEIVANDLKNWRTRRDLNPRPPSTRVMGFSMMGRTAF